MIFTIFFLIKTVNPVLNLINTGIKKQLPCFSSNLLILDNPAVQMTLCLDSLFVGLQWFNKPCNVSQVNTSLFYS